MVDRLLLVAHGTASDAGLATISRIAADIAAARPEVPVSLCYLDVAAPSLPDMLDEQPTTAVPLLLSMGYHVQLDIPEAVAAVPRTRVARHLGPHALLVDALCDRLTQAGGASCERLLLVGAGSTRSGARAELAECARMLAERTGADVSIATMADDLEALLSIPASQPSGASPLGVVSYLLAEGSFIERLQRAATAGVVVSAPLGAHPALTQLVWNRYDEVRATG